MLEKLKKSYKESSHNEHFKYGIYAALVGTILFAAGCAFGLEYKEKKLKEINDFGNGFDWDDFWWTIAGGMIGQTIQALIVLIIIFFYN